MHPHFSGRALALAAGLAIVLSDAAALAEELPKRPWPVSWGEPQTLTISHFGGLLEAIAGSIMGRDHYTVTIHEVSTSEPAPGYDIVAETTGNSLTFKVPTRNVIKTMMTGSGAKRVLPLSLHQYEGEITDKFEAGRCKRTKCLFTARIETPWAEGAARRREGRNDEPPYASDIRAALHGQPVRLGHSKGWNVRNSPEGLFTFAGRRHCGMLVFRDGEEYSSTNQLRLKELEPPFSDGNVFVRMGKGGAVERIVTCELGGRACRTVGFLNDWATFNVAFEDERLCEVETIVEGVSDWFNRHTVGETVAPGRSGQSRRERKSLFPEMSD